MTPDDPVTADARSRIGLLRSYAAAIVNTPEALDLDAVMRRFEGALNAIEAVLILLGEARGCCYNCGTVPTAWENFDPAGVRATILANLTGEEARDDRMGWVRR